MSHFKTTETSLKTRPDRIERRIRCKTYEKLRNVLVFIKNGKKEEATTAEQGSNSNRGARAEEGWRDRRRYHPPINMCSKLVIYNLL